MRSKEINVRAKLLKPSEENKGINLCDLELGNGFLYMTPNAQPIRDKYIGHDKNFLCFKGHSEESKKKIQIGEIFHNSYV